MEFEYEVLMQAGYSYEEFHEAVMLLKSHIPHYGHV